VGKKHCKPRCPRCAGCPLEEFLPGRDAGQKLASDQGLESGREPLTCHAESL
jgi:adenine-specific DNA glycosylase